MSHFSSPVQAFPQRKTLEQTPPAMLAAFNRAAAAALAQSSWRWDASSQRSDWTLDDKSAGPNSMWRHINKIGLFPIWITYPDGDCILIRAVFLGGRQLGSRCIFNIKCEERSLTTNWKERKHFDWTWGFSWALIQRITLHSSTSFSLQDQVVLNHQWDAVHFSNTTWHEFSSSLLSVFSWTLTLINS